MTATDELRRLLDERGVEWWEEYGFTYWRNRFGYSCNCATGHESGMVSVLFDVKPEQAIAATLGRGTCEMEYVPDWMGWHCKSCDNLRQGLRDQKPRYCPNCGRKVVDA